MTQIIQATAAADYAAVRQIYYQTWLATYQDELPAAFLAQLTPETWHPENDYPNLLLAENAGQLAGLVKWGKARAAKAPAPGELQALYVLPKFQHQGIGRLLMAAALDKLSQFDSAYLTVLAANEHARQVYEKAGWVQVGSNFTKNTAQGVLEVVNYRYQF